MKKIIIAFVLSLILIPSLSFAQRPPNYIGPPIVGDICTDLTANLHYGYSDQNSLYISNQVTMLQGFLIRNGYGSFDPTGYFGSLTRQAVIKFQTSQGIVPAHGFVGPITRARIKAISCVNTSSNVSISSITPTSGAIGTSINIYGSGFDSTGNTVNFGQGEIRNVPSRVYVISNNGGFGTALTFFVPDTISPACTYLNPPCAIITVQTPSGEYPVSVTNSKGTSNSLKFTVTSATSNQPPVINSVSAPTRLNVNQTGTWTVKASDPQNSQLTYSVSWGDANCPPEFAGPACINNMGTPTPSDFQQSASFTHSYSQAGTYTQTFVVRNSAGLESKTITTVEVIVPASSTLSLTSISPTSGPVNTQVTLRGAGFSSTGNKINISGGEYYNLSNLNSSNNGTIITFNIPAWTDYACLHSNPQCDIPVQMTQIGDHTISVTNSNGTTNTVNFKVTASS